MLESPDDLVVEPRGSMIGRSHSVVVLSDVICNDAFPKVECSVHAMKAEKCE